MTAGMHPRSIRRSVWFPPELRLAVGPCLGDGALQTVARQAQLCQVAQRQPGLRQSALEEVVVQVQVLQGLQRRPAVRQDAADGIVLKQPGKRKGKKSSYEYREDVYLSK